MEESGTIKTKYFADNTTSALSALSEMYAIISDLTGFSFLDDASFTVMYC